MKPCLPGLCVAFLSLFVQASEPLESPTIHSLYNRVPVRKAGVEVIVTPEVLQLYGGGRGTIMVHVRNLTDQPLQGWSLMRFPDRSSTETKPQQCWIAPGATLSQELTYSGTVEDRLLNGTFVICTQKGLLEVPVWVEHKTKAAGMSAPLPLEQYYNTDIITDSLDPKTNNGDGVAGRVFPFEYTKPGEARLGGITFMLPAITKGSFNAIRGKGQRILMDPRPSEGFALVVCATQPIKQAPVSFIDNKGVAHTFHIDIPAFDETPDKSALTGFTAPYHYRDSRKINEPMNTYVVPILFGETIRISSVDLPDNDNLYTLATSSLRVRANQASKKKVRIRG